MRRLVAVLFACVCGAMLATSARAEWRPPDLRPAKSSLTDVLAAYAKAAGTPDARFGERRERWTYVNDHRHLPVEVAVRGSDFRATVVLGSARYAAGRSEGVRWRADANGITHATLSDDQGDAVDRLPQSIFPFAAADCGLAGESERFGPAWVLVDRAPRDKPHWFYVDKTTGAIAHEITREGRRTIVTAFDRFETTGGARRPRHWRVTDGDAAHDLDVTVEAIEPQSLAETDVAIPQTHRVFAPANPAPGKAIVIPARFIGRTIVVDVDVGGRREGFVLDTGTASIMLDAGLAARRGWTPQLEHATVPRMTIGPLAMTDVSTLAIPFDIGNMGLGPVAGILGYDFFLGHVVHVDYAHGRVEVLASDDARAVFADPRNYVTDAYYDEGIPLVHAAFGSAAGDRFALDTGSPFLFVFEPFERRHAKEIAAHWSPATFRGGRPTETEFYLEGSIVVTARRVADFSLGPYRFANLVVGIEQANSRADAIDLFFDGIVGTNEMSAFEWWFDYDGGRIALRRNPSP